VVNWVGGAFIVFAFFGLLKAFRVIEVSKDVITLSSTVMSTMTDNSMSDLEKEKAMQSFSIRFFKYFISILIGSALAIAIPVLVLWGLQQLGLLSLDDIIATTLTWEFITISCLLGLALLTIPRLRG
jgi:uncharacterized membrane protein YkgB